MAGSSRQRVYSIERGLRTLKDPELFKQYREDYPSAIKVKSVPSMATMTRWHRDGVCKTTDGCKVEPDGTCSHGYPSWMLVLNYI